MVFFYCVEPIFAFLKYVTKLKYDERPDYEKCRKIFVDGLKSLGKTNSGDLEFKVSSASTSNRKSVVAVSTSPVKERPKIGRPAAKAAVKVADNVENISPKPKGSRKRDPLNDSSEESASPSKKVRSSKTSTQVRATKVSSRTTTTTTTTSKSANSSVIVKNHVNEEKGKKNKTYNINLDLDISFDANVIVNVKRKKKKSPKEEVESPNQSIQSTDEIPPSDKSFIVATKVYKRAPRASPRTK